MKTLLIALLLIIPVECLADRHESSSSAVPLIPATSMPATSAPSRETTSPLTSTTPTRIILKPLDDSSRIEASTSPATTPSDTNTINNSASNHSLLGASLPKRPKKHQDNRILNQWLVISRTKEEAMRQQRLLENYGLVVKKQSELKNLNFILTIYEPPVSSDAETLFNTIKSKHPELIIEFNQRHQLLNNAKTYAPDSIGFSGISSCNESNITIAILDSSANTLLPIFDQQRIHYHDITNSSNGNTAHYHGTAIAALLIGEQGALPNATLHALNIFIQDGDTSITQTDWILTALNQLPELSPRPTAINLSFGGDYSQINSLAFKRLSKSFVFVAAAGNDGPDAKPRYPAAYPEVIAVSAINHQQQIYDGANSGDYIDFAAPGVDVWTVDHQGNGFYATGTSYSTPWVTAAMALAIKNNKELSDLIHHSTDLGNAGKDQHYGYGALNIKELCT